MRISNILKLIFSILVCQLAGIMGSIFTSPSIPVWYAGLQKPLFTPPSWVFAPVWIFLFTLMGLSLYLILKRSFKDRLVKLGILVFGIQLVLNTGWSIIFFGLRNPCYAFLEILVLILAISFTIILFWKINRKTAYLLLPYLVWVVFAAFLNFSIWRLNSMI